MENFLVTKVGRHMGLSKIRGGMAEIGFLFSDGILIQSSEKEKHQNKNKLRETHRPMKYGTASE
jgi:hypothetical protein